VEEVLDVFGLHKSTNNIHPKQMGVDGGMRRTTANTQVKKPPTFQALTSRKMSSDWIIVRSDSEDSNAQQSTGHLPVYM
jgi:hypothetical protein